ncbi:MAG: alkaline phosphatase, partial [Proteobacteria bacterium]|nr:alkaline phosphatase [Pseudomonadota bacterium]
LFESGHMQYEADRSKDAAGEPSLSQMTRTALEILKRKDKSFFLMVEGGRIDHAHHAGNAYRSLKETVEFSNAVQVAVEMVNLDETLIIVTADHSHTMTISGYAQRGNPILGKIINPDKFGDPSENYQLDAQNKTMTTLSYANGPGYVNGDQRLDLKNVDAQSPDYKQAATIPMRAQTHSGEDVTIYATGAGSQLFRGVMEQNVIFHIMKYALSQQLKRKVK